MDKDFPKFQYSQFDKLDGQYVVRTDDQEEFKKLVAMVKMATGVAFSAPQAPKTAISGEKPKVPYMWAGDTCPLCHKGVLVATVKETKDGKKYNALVCDQDGCWGKAYPSKYPKKQEAEPFADHYANEVENADIPF